MVLLIAQRRGKMTLDDWGLLVRSMDHRRPLNGTYVIQRFQDTERKDADGSSANPVL